MADANAPDDKRPDPTPPSGWVEDDEDLFKRLTVLFPEFSFGDPDDPNKRYITITRLSSGRRTKVGRLAAASASRKAEQAADLKRRLRAPLPFRRIQRRCAENKSDDAFFGEVYERMHGTAPPKRPLTKRVKRWWYLLSSEFNVSLADLRKLGISGLRKLIHGWLLVLQWMAQHSFTDDPALLRAEPAELLRLRKLVPSHSKLALALDHRLAARIVAGPWEFAVTAKWIRAAGPPRALDAIADALLACRQSPKVMRAAEDRYSVARAIATCGAISRLGYNLERAVQVDSPFEVSPLRLATATIIEQWLERQTGLETQQRYRIARVIAADHPDPEDLWLDGATCQACLFALREMALGDAQATARRHLESAAAHHDAERSMAALRFLRGSDEVAREFCERLFAEPDLSPYLVVGALETYGEGVEDHARSLRSQPNLHPAVAEACDRVLRMSDSTGP